LNKQPCYLNSELINTDPKLPISEKAFESGISLPSSYNISKKQLKYICAVINKFKPDD